jgi:hypothetical protein
MGTSIDNDWGDVFRENVLSLTSYLQTQFDLEEVDCSFRLVDGWKCGYVVLANRFIEIKFVAGVPRDQYVDVTIRKRNAITGSEKRGLHVGAYASKLGVRHQFFPEVFSDTTKKRFLVFGSLAQIASYTIFMSIHCAEFLCGAKSPTDP